MYLAGQKQAFIITIVFIFLLLGCPRHPVTNVECSNRGNCDSEKHECMCDAGWEGAACHTGDCPGHPNCFNRGICNETTSPPRCVSCHDNWMGPACNDPCLHGKQEPMDSGICVCEEGWTGVGCNSECSENGKISLITGKCICTYELGWKGPVCNIPGCPGLNNTDCSGRGLYIKCFMFSYTNNNILENHIEKENNTKNKYSLCKVIANWKCLRIKIKQQK